MTDSSTGRRASECSIFSLRLAAIRTPAIAGAWALLAAGLLALPSAQFSPAHAAVTCGSWEQGTLDANGNWTAGSGTDYRTVCTADTDGDVVELGDIPSPRPDGAARLVIDVSDPNVDGNRAHFNLGPGVTSPALTGTHGRTDDYARAIDIAIVSITAGSEGDSYEIESFSTIHTSGKGGRGIHFRNNDPAHTGRIEAINHGSITTSGNEFAEGIRAETSATSAQAEVKAVNKGTITTTGQGSWGIYVRNGSNSAATVTAVNEGTVTTTGDTTVWTDNNSNSSPITSNAVRAHNWGGGDAQAINEAGARIETSGSGARGLYARARSGSGDALATNDGSIVTRGDAYGYAPGSYSIPASGIRVASADGDATARNQAGGSVETHGTTAYGVSAYSSNGHAIVENFGTVTTHGGSNSALPGSVGIDIGSRGLYAGSGSGNATITNESSGSVETKGARGFGLFALISNRGSSGSATAVARNKGSVATTGDNADGVLSFGSRGGTAANPNRVEAYNSADATITTSTDGSSGLGAIIRTNAGVPMGGVDAFGSAYARNDGTITTAGGRSGATSLDSASGMSIGHYSSDGTVINNAGDVEAVNTGMITVTGPNARGIQAATFGTGMVTVTVDGGTITASHDSATDDAEDGVGIYASTGTGGIVATVSNRASITAPQAVLFEGAPATLTLSESVMRGRVSFADEADEFIINDGVLRGNVSMGDGDDTVSVQFASNIVGDIDFGAGSMDTLLLDVTEPSRLSGNITNLEYMTKSCPGDFTIDGDVAFTGSSVLIEEGGLVITGHMNLGTMGSVTVKDGSRLTGLLTQGGTPKITAGSTTVDTGGAITMQKSDAGAVDAEQAVTTFLEDANVDAAVTVQTQDGDGSLTELASFDPSTSMATPMAGAAVGTRSAEEFVDETTVGMPSTGTGGTGGGTAGTGGSGGGGSGGGGGGAAALGVGMLALIFALFDFGPDDAQASISAKPAFVQTMDRETRYWTRSLSQSLSAGGIDRAEGVEIGMEVGVGNGFSLGFSAVPDMAAERIGSAEDVTAVAGSRYSVSGGWQEDGLFARLRLSHADLRVDGSFENPTVGGGFRSQFDAEQNDIRLNVGTRIDLGGVTVTPEAGAFAGTVEREGHTAEGGIFRASMPGLTQRYSGVKAGLGFAADWQEGPEGLRVRPSLKLTAMQVRSDSPEYELRQSDRLGILSTTSQARLPDAPETVFGLGAGFEATGSGGLRMRFGYAGAILDGKVVHAVGGGLQLKF